VGAALTDDEVASVLTYIRQAWGNGGSPVKPEEVKTMRDKINEKGQADPWTVESLIKAFPEK
jgi:mono/diheme cytochrome c family protein